MSVSEIGFGAWAIGGAAMVGNVPIGWGTADDETSKRALAKAIDAGINFFDTADFYGLGHSEQLIGEVIGNRQDLLVATKVGQREGEGSTVYVDYSRDYIISACDKSLHRLKRERIDFYQLHVARLIHLNQGECIEAMETLKQAGKIRYWGISLNTFQPAPEAEWFFENNKGDGFQLVLNLINREGLSILKKAEEGGYGVIARMALQFGLLGGKVSPDKNYGQDDHRSYRTNREFISAINQTIDHHILPLAEKYNTTPAGIALSFVLGFNEVSTVIAGMRNEQQVEQNSKETVVLSHDDHQLLLERGADEWQQLWEMARMLG